MRSMRSGERGEAGSALALTLIAITALLGLGAITVMSVQSELQASGQTRFKQAALYAAESGANAGMQFLRISCNPTTLFSGLMSPNNSAPQMPVTIVGNNVQPGVWGNPFPAGTNVWYQVSFLNNVDDSGFATGHDNDGRVILHSVGHGPDGAMSVVEVEVFSKSCMSTFCQNEYAQRDVNARNDANAICSSAVTSGALRSYTP